MTTEIIAKIECEEKFDFESTFDIYKKCSELVVDNETEAQKIVVNILNNRLKFDENLNEVLADLIEAVGFYPYLKKEHLHLDSTDALIREAYHISENIGLTFHEDQKHILRLINSDKNVIVSAPTSFGKSLLIEEIISSKKFKNILIIQPTLALLDETRRKLLKYKDNFKITVRTSQEPSSDLGNIFLFTSERVNEYRNFPRIDILIIDEFYKLSAKRDDERADSLNNAFNYILKTFNSKFYLLGPNIDRISEGFAEKYNAVFFKSNSSLVDSKAIDVYTPNKEQFDKPIKFKAEKEKILFDLLLDLKDEQTIIYCSSPNRVRELSKKFLKYVLEKKINLENEQLDLIEWIEINVSKSWSLINLLRTKIGIHDGALQKHISTSIIEYFNSNKLNFLFCTSTIIEGVNTSAKNVIYFDATKGRRTKIDFFDYSNIKGRAGRLMSHYVGKIYNFNEVPPNTQIVIDIPFFEQNPISDEVLINLDEQEVRTNNEGQFQKIKQIPEKERNIIKSNGVQVFGQKSIFEKLRSDIDIHYNLISWTAYPTKDQLAYTLKLAWDNLLKPTETVSPMTLNKLVYVTQIYGSNQNIWVLVASTFRFFKSKNPNLSDEETYDLAILDSFQILKHWFEYKVPKWLSVINSIQEFVCNENGLRPGNYSFYSKLIETDFLRDNLSILYEYGIPSSAIRKLEKFVSPKLDEDEVIRYIKKNKIYENPDFIAYEKNKFNNI